MNLEQVSINSIANSVKTVDTHSSLCEEPVQTQHAFEAGLQLAGASRLPARASGPFRSNELCGEALLVQDVSGPATLRPCPPPESSASVEGTLQRKLFVEQESCSSAEPFADEQWVSAEKSVGQSARQSCSVGAPNDAESPAQHNGHTAGDERSNAGQLQSKSIRREFSSESFGSFSSRRTGNKSLSTSCRAGASSVEPQRPKQLKMGETTSCECNPERSWCAQEFSEPLISIGDTTKWKQQQSAFHEPGSCKCQLTESLLSPGISFQRAPLEEASHRLCGRPLGREAQQASFARESSTDGPNTPSGLSSRTGFDGNTTSANGSPAKDAAGQGQSIERDSSAVGQGSSYAVTGSSSDDERSAESNGEGLSYTNAQQCCVKILGTTSCQRLPKSQGPPNAEGSSFLQGSPIDERSPASGCSLSIKRIQGSSSITRSSFSSGSSLITGSCPIKGSPLLERPVEGQSSVQGFSVIKGSINTRSSSEGSSSNQGSFSEELPELQGSTSIEGSSSIARLSCIQEPSFITRSCIHQGLPSVQRPYFPESFPAPGTGSSLITNQLSRRRIGTVVAPIGSGSPSSVSTESSSSSSVRSAPTPKHGPWSTAFTGSPKTLPTESTTSTIVGAASPAADGRTSPIVAESLTTISSGSFSRTSVQTPSGIAVESSSQINDGWPPGSLLQSAARASVGSPQRVSSGECSRATFGSPSRTASGSPSRGASGSPTRATSGSPSWASLGSPPRATDGLPSRISAQSSWRLTPRTLTESPANRDGAFSSTTPTEPPPAMCGSATPTAIGPTPPNTAGLPQSHGQAPVASSVTGKSARQAHGGTPQLASAATPPQTSLPVEQAGSPGASSGGAFDSTTSRCLESGRGPGDEQHAWEDSELGVDEGEATPATESAKGIKAIDRGAVHHICSGQVVVSLATAVKELVENSLDAGSSSVEVRLTGSGATTITVTDDGPGVHPNDFQALALKHHTSKLRDFDGLTAGVETFGFRGEALSSLCALSKLVVCTRHKSQAVGSSLVYDSNGVLTENTPVSRQVGTTVTLSGLFTSLPVRRREFERNLKKEYHKLLQVLQSYAIIATNVRLHVSNQSDAGSRRHTVLATSGFPTLMENVTAIFGAKQVSGLVPLKQSDITEEELTEYRIPRTATQDGAAFKIEGLISSGRHGGGRSAPDRQFYFVNSRPCDPAKVTRVVNEVYRNYNRHQYPCVVLNVITERQSVDVNLTPDKRQVLVHHEKLLLATLKSSLRRLFDDTPHTISLNTKHSTTKTKASVLQQTLLPHTAPREVVTSSSDNTASPLLHAFIKKGSNTGSPKQSKLSRLKQLCIASPMAEHPSLLTDETAIQAHSPMSVFIPTSLPSTPRTPTLSSGNKQAQCDTVGKGSPLVARLALFSAPSTPPSGSATYNKDHFSKSDYSRSSSNNTISTSLVNDEPEHCTAAENGSNDHHSPGSCNNDTRATSSKRAIAAAAPDDELPMPVQKRPRFDLSVDSNKENHSCLINVAKAGDSADADPEVLALPTHGLDSEGRVEDDPSQHEEESTSDDCGNTSKPLEVNSIAATEDETFVVELEEEPMDASSTVPFTNTRRGSLTSRKSIGAHDATDSFLTRLLAAKREPCVRNAADKDSNQGPKVRNSLKKFLNPRFETEVEENIAKKDDDDISVTFDGTNHELQNEAIISAIEPEAEDSPYVGQSEPLVCYDDEVSGPSSRNCKSISVDCSLAEIQKALHLRRQEQEKAKDKKIVRHFHAKIAPTDNKTAEDELNKVLSKDMFAKMQILGQFNLGFIITRLKSDLFIVDQHATDEKFNFETLQQTCVLQHQPLITPLDLELTPGNEAILLDNLEVFITNGFQFDIDENLPFGHRVKLKSVPQSRNWSFGKEDVDELIFMLSDSPGHMCRPSRVRAMFASRACRKSVMVGTALSTGRMRELVDNMGKIEQPWNCPHGRPTVRHLVNLDMIAHEGTNLPEKSTDV